MNTAFAPTCAHTATETIQKQPAMTHKENNLPIFISSKYPERKDYQGV